MIACAAARRTMPCAVFIKRDDDGGATELFCHLRRDQTDHASVPTRACNDSNRAAIAARFVVCKRPLGQPLLHHLALAVARVEMLRKAPRFRWIIGFK